VPYGIVLDRVRVRVRFAANSTTLHCQCLQITYPNVLAYLPVPRGSPGLAPAEGPPSLSTCLYHYRRVSAIHYSNLTITIITPFDNDNNFKNNDRHTGYPHNIIRRICTVISCRCGPKLQRNVIFDLLSTSKPPRLLIAHTGLMNLSRPVLYFPLGLGLRLRSARSKAPIPRPTVSWSRVTPRTIGQLVRYSFRRRVVHARNRDRRRLIPRAFRCRWGENLPLRPAKPLLLLFGNPNTDTQAKQTLKVEHSLL